jgi:hypothetical protein
MYFLHPNQTGTHPAGKKQPFVFLYRKHTAGDLRKAKRQQGAPTKSRHSTRQKAGTQKQKPTASAIFANPSTRI